MDSRNNICREAFFFMKKQFELLLNKSQLPKDVEGLQDMVVRTAKSFLEHLDYLESELAVLRRFQFGQRSERLKKKRLKSRTTTK